MDFLTHAFNWLLSPLSGRSDHFIESSVYWHARSMVMAWAICLPLGALVARYFKIMPSQDWPRVTDNKFWWHLHRTLQYSGVMAMTVGVWLIWSATDAPTFSLAGLHQWLGWFVLVLGWSQMMGGIFRGTKGGPTDSQLDGDHYNMTRWRVVFEYLHKSLGWLAIGLAVVVIVLGLILADAPRWMLCILIVWWLALLAAGIYLQKRSGCIDTYQAIWGPDPSLPGLKRPPIGWGIHRSHRHPWR